MKEEIFGERKMSSSEALIGVGSPGWRDDVQKGQQ